MMKKSSIRKVLSLIGCIVLIAAMALSFTGCSTGKPNETPAETGESVTFQFVVTDPDGKDTTFDITSDKKTVGEALQEEGLIEGEMGEYGLYVTTVNGITLDWDKDQMYWAFYIDGEYAATSVDLTEITEGVVYSFVAQAG